RFGDLVAIIHSKLTRKKRLTEINKIELNQARILLGTRSAIFSNMSNLGLIIVDEEHDDSYKLDNYNKYDVREVARFIIERTPDAKLVLGSATPSIETFYKAKNGIYELHVIEERPNKVKMPRIMVTDMREELKSGNKTAFSLDLMASMKESLNKDKQILLFLNRRGYSTFVTCRSCGYTSKCHRCDVSLVYHKKNNLLKCHYCGHMEKTPSTCPNCGSRDIRQFGMGTEKLEEETKSLFPDFQIMRIDSDTTSRAETYRENVEKILKKEVSIIIGTQMISKGFDFPEIDLVGIIASDLSLNVPEYDAAEKTFQLIMQVSGRSGRNDERGNVIIQTYNPEHYSIRHAKNNDYNGFYEDELKIRKIFSYPPFKRQYIITILNRDLNDGINISKKLFDALLEEISNKKIGKYVDIISHRDRMSISRLNNRYHINILLNSTIRHEKFIKNIIYEVFIKNKFKINLNNTHVDVVTR
ncbi:MAG: primosomal protein N', partial [Tissierellia bacterium]|nr:primosomal protein N' [Tissierellia bacterium]